MMNRVISFLVFVLCGSLLCAQSVNELYEAYSRAEKSADWPAAEAAARQGMAKYPEQTGFVTGLTYALRMQKKVAEALRVIEPAYKKKPAETNLRNSYVYTLLDFGWELFAAQDNTGAAEQFQIAYQLKPDDEWTVNAWGYIQGKIGQLDEGITLLKKGRLLFPENSYIRGNLVALFLDAGWQYYHTKEYSAALVFFRDAQAVNPEDEWVLNALGATLRDSGELDRGIAFLERGLKKYPANDSLKGNLLWAYILKANQLREKYHDQKPWGQKETAEINSWFGQAEKLGPIDESYLLNYGIFLNDIDRYDEAIGILEKGRELFPANPYFQGNIQYAFQKKERALKEKKDYSAALAVILEARKRFPDEGWFLVDQMECYFGLKQYDAYADTLVFFSAHKKLKEYGKDFSYDRDEIVRTRLSPLVWKWCELKKFEAAFLLIRKIDANMPARYFVKEMQGLAAYHSGKKDEGIKLVNEAYEVCIAAHPEAKKTITLPLPLRGTFLVAGNNRTDAITHAGLDRFCYDFMGANSQGEVIKPGVVFPGTANSDYYGFGAPIYSTVDGVVEGIIDSYEDILPRAQAFLGDGNQIIIKDADGQHHIFAHIKQGSVPLKAGDAVRAGDKIAELGNNGYTAYAHLHYGVYTPDWKVSLEVKFESYKLIDSGGALREIKNSVPQTGDVIVR